MKHTIILIYVITHLFLFGCKSSEGEDSKFLSKYPNQIKSLLVSFESCALDENSIKDLNKIAEYILKVNMQSIPSDWNKRFCDSQKNHVFEYIVQTKGIEGTPIILKQTDFTNDGDALVPHYLIVGGHTTPEFNISVPDEIHEYMNFPKWTGNCIPFLFDIESEDSWLLSRKNESPSAAVYYIASLCRNDKFRFKYYRHKDRKWSEIDKSEFPKTRALENLWEWQSGGIKYSRDTPKSIQDGLKISPDVFVRERLKFNPESFVFYTGLTARVWAHLESNVDFWEFDQKFTDESAKNHAIMYSTKYSIK